MYTMNIHKCVYKHKFIQLSCYKSGKCMGYKSPHIFPHLSCTVLTYILAAYLSPIIPFLSSFVFCTTLENNINQCSLPARIVKIHVYTLN